MSLRELIEQIQKDAADELKALQKELDLIQSTLDKKQCENASLRTQNQELREEVVGLKREYVELGCYIADRVGIKRQPDFNSTISEITITIFDLRKALAQTKESETK